MSEVQRMLKFIEESPTAFHAVANLSRALEKAGFVQLQEAEPWRLAPGSRCFVTRNQSALIALSIPQTGFGHFQIVASHADSPCFKLKPNADRSEAPYALLNVEKYGGMLMSTWLDRPLSVAGRLVTKGEKGLEARLVNLDRPVALIPNMPIHFNRAANDGVALNAQVDMLPVIGPEGADMAALVAEAANVEKNDIAGCDLFLYNRDRGTLWGAGEEYIASPRLDDLECACTSLRAFLESAPAGHINALCVFDNEEVGSGSKQGADSDFLERTLRRAALALGADDQALEAALAASFMVSADNAHAVHPNHADKYDRENRVTMNGGIVVKANANQKYTSDGVSSAVFEQICAAAGVPTQRFSNRSDIAGGSTLGNIANAHVSMNTVDIGLAQLAMHSAMESAGAQDVDHMIRGLKAFYDANVSVVRDGRIDLA